MTALDIKVTYVKEDAVTSGSSKESKYLIGVKWETACSLERVKVSFICRHSIK